MRTRRILTILVLGLGLMVRSVEVVAQEPITTAFTYQGFLKDKDKPIDDEFDLEFRLFDANVDGSQLGLVTYDNYLVVDGHVAVELDFGSDVFTGQRRWLQVSIHKSNAPQPFTDLAPRLELTLTPYALYALYAEDANNTNDANTLDGFHADNLPYINGGGTANRIALFADANTLADSTILQSGGNIGIGTASPSETLHVAGSVRIADGTEGQGRVLTSDASGVASWQALPDAVPAGVIVMWSGATTDIPPGWALCDGTDGTPNLTDRFIVGAGDTYFVNQTGGEARHTLTIAEMPSHSHPGLATEKRVGDADAHDYDMFKCQPAGASGAAGGDQPHENRPPYYALAYIMRTGN
jgi:microcystin-dependent protein